MIVKGLGQRRVYVLAIVAFSVFLLIVPSFHPFLVHYFGDNQNKVTYEESRLKKSSFCFVSDFTTNNSIYLNSNSIFINASWDLFFNPASEMCYIQILLKDLNNNLIWNSTKNNETGSIRENWTVAIWNLLLTEFSSTYNLSFFFYSYNTITHRETSEYKDLILIEIIRKTTFCILNPANNTEYLAGKGDNFNITVEYLDEIVDSGISGADINYSLNGGISFKTLNENVKDISDGNYNITVNIDDLDFVEYGYSDITLKLSKCTYTNHTRTLRIIRTISTTISPNNTIQLPSIHRGFQICYVFNYSDANYNPILGAEWKNVSDHCGLNPSLQEENNGNYSMRLNTNGNNIGDYSYTFNVSSPGCQTQEITLNFTILAAQTSLVVDSYNSIIPVYIQGNQTIRFRINDTSANELILGLDTSMVSVRDQDGKPWGKLAGDHNFTLHDYNCDGNYSLDISIKGLSIGWHTAIVNVDPGSNYADQQLSVKFYVRGCYFSANLIAIADPSGVIKPNVNKDHKNYAVYVNSDVFIIFNLTEDEFSDSIVLGETKYSITYINVFNSSDTGSILHDLKFELINESYGYHSGILNLSQSLNVTGLFVVTITITKPNYENTTLTILFNIKEKIKARLELYDIPSEIIQGEQFVIKIKALYRNNSKWLPLAGVEVKLVTCLKYKAASIYYNNTSDSGIASFYLVTTSDVEKIAITVNLRANFKFESKPIEITGMNLNKSTQTVFMLPTFILILVGAVSGGLASIMIVIKVIITPKRRNKRKLLREIEAIFKDAPNIEYILVLYKETGTCIFFKSYSTEGFNPELIDGLFCTISSYGRKEFTQKDKNQISYEDKKLLLADGVYVRAALVLSEPASMVLRNLLNKFVNQFEEKHKNQLPNWRGQLYFFKDVGRLIENILKISIILPHELVYQTSYQKRLKNSKFKELVRITSELVTKSGKEFFFINTLINFAIEEMNQGRDDVIFKILELKDKGILKPLDISAIEQVPISQQKATQISQKVNDLTNLNTEEKQNLVQELIILTLAECYLYFLSLEEQTEIVSVPIESNVNTTEIKNEKSAKKVIKKLKKKGRRFTKIKIYDYAKENYLKAQKIAIDWELKKELSELEETRRQLYKIELEESLKIRELDATKAIESSDYDLAQEKYEEAIAIANDIFRLGFGDIGIKMDDLKENLEKIPLLTNEKE